MLTLKNDVIFKAVYGRENRECKEALIAVLNLILERETDPITSIEYRNPFNLREHPSQKESILDIKAETSSRELLDLEIHLFYDEQFVPRNIYYHGGLLKEALETGEEYGKIKETVSIYIVNFTLFRQTDHFHCQFLLREKDKGFTLTDIMRLHYLELPKVNPGKKKPVSKLTKLERYLEYLRCAGVPEEADYVEELKQQGGKEITMTDSILRKVTEDDILREQAIAREKFLLEQFHRNQYNKQWEAKNAEREAKNEEREVKNAEREAKNEEREVKNAEWEAKIEEKLAQIDGIQQQLAEKEAKLAEKEALLEAAAQKVAKGGMTSEQIEETTKTPK